MDTLGGSRDEFEEYRARANSGGDLFWEGSRSPGDNGGRRQRSKSLVPKITRDISPESERCMTRTQNDGGRRFTTACFDGRDILAVPTLYPYSSRAVSDEDWGSGVRMCRSRTPSLPGHSPTRGPDRLKPPEASLFNMGFQHEERYRRRSFSITPKGIVNEGDSIVLKSANGINLTELAFPDSELGGMDHSRASSFASLGSAALSGASSQESPFFRVIVVGSLGVGKSALIQQFQTSEYKGAENTSFDEGEEVTVPVLLDGEECNVEFLDVDIASPEEMEVIRATEADGHILVYSIIDKKSFQRAQEILHEIRHVEDRTTALILVGNKSDLVRSRAVSEDDGRNAATKFDCKYIEVSAVLNHKVDDLLVGIVKQIKFNSHRRERSRRASKDRSEVREPKCLQRAKQTVFSKLFRSEKVKSKSCEDLLVL